MAVSAVAHDQGRRDQGQSRPTRDRCTVDRTGSRGEHSAQELRGRRGLLDPRRGGSRAGPGPDAPLGPLRSPLHLQIPFRSRARGARTRRLDDRHPRGPQELRDLWRAQSGAIAERDEAAVAPRETAHRVPPARGPRIRASASISADARLAGLRDRGQPLDQELGGGRPGGPASRARLGVGPRSATAMPPPCPRSGSKPVEALQRPGHRLLRQVPAGRPPAARPSSRSGTPAAGGRRANASAGGRVRAALAPLDPVPIADA